MLAVVHEPAEAELPYALADVDHDGIRPFPAAWASTAAGFLAVSVVAGDAGWSGVRWAGFRPTLGPAEGLP